MSEKEKTSDRVFYFFWIFVKPHALRRSGRIRNGRIKSKVFSIPVNEFFFFCVFCDLWKHHSSVEESLFLAGGAELLESARDRNGEGISRKSFVSFLEVLFGRLVGVDKVDVESEKQGHKNREGRSEGREDSKENDEKNSKSFIFGQKFEASGFYQRVDRAARDDPEEDHLPEDVKDEPKVVLFPDADPDPRTMMVELLDTVIADVAMCAARRSSRVAIGAVLQRQSEGVDREA